MVSAHRDGGDAEAVDRFGRQVLERVDGEVTRPVEQGGAQFGCEDPQAARAGKRALGDVPERLDPYQFDPVPERAQLVRHLLGLRNSERRSAGAEAKPHA